MGQVIWRYHPETKRYEVFAEGGGNAFGVEFDADGRIFSGHNGGNTRGFHYVQGGYFQKGFDKHGPLSNPYAFGYFPAMKHPEVQRFTHTFVVYNGDALPKQYRGTLFGVAPLLHHVVMSKLEPDGSTFRTHDVGLAAATKDPHFIPVDIKQGPDGALYVADWYDEQCNHYRNHEGQLDKSTGRIYRLRAANSPSYKPEDFSKLTSLELVERLKNPNKWQRQTALRLLADRHDEAVAPLLTQQLTDERGQLALESLWALNLVGRLDESTRLAALNHANPQVRLWTVRLMCDMGNASATESKRLFALAREENDPEVCCQIACSARRLPAKVCLAIVRNLLERQNADDARLPLLVWWAIEAKVAFDPSAVADLFRDPAIWRTPIVKRDITERIMRRFAATRHRKDLVICADLLNLAPTPDDVKRLMTGFEAAYAGQSLPDLPNELAAALQKHNGTSIVVGLRRGSPGALEEALSFLQDEHADRSKQLQYLQVLGEVSQPGCVPTLLALATSSSDNGLQAAALRSLSRYDDARIPPAVISSFPKMSDDVRAASATLLASRANWTLTMLHAIESRQISKSWISPDLVQRMSIFSNSDVHVLVRKLWPDVQTITPDDLKKEIQRIAGVLPLGIGHPKSGKAMFSEQCSKCHKLFGEGGEVGPDLTSFNRADINAMLLSIVHPSAEIREGYNGYVVITIDGRSLTGTLADQDPQTVTLHTPDGASLPIPRSEIDEMTVSKSSLMPDGLLKSYSDEQLRDLFAYLRMTQPLIDH
jgi:putative heme-binding domain-containing protein